MIISIIILIFNFLDIEFVEAFPEPKIESDIEEGNKNKLSINK
jgi:hypothetical protein